MSITFAPAMEAMQYQISCGCGEAVAKQVFPSFEVAYKIFTSTVPFEKPVCADEDCALYFGHTPRIRAFNEDALQLNMAGGNAGRILALLGLDNDGQGGVADAAWFLNLVQEKLDGNSTINYAPYAGYEQDILTQLETIASYAAERGAPVVWS